MRRCGTAGCRTGQERHRWDTVGGQGGGQRSTRLGPPWSTRAIGRSSTKSATSNAAMIAASLLARERPGPDQFGIEHREGAAALDDEPHGEQPQPAEDEHDHERAARIGARLDQPGQQRPDRRREQDNTRYVDPGGVVRRATRRAGTAQRRRARRRVPPLPSTTPPSRRGRRLRWPGAAPRRCRPPGGTPHPARPPGLGAAFREGVADQPAAGRDERRAADPGGDPTRDEHGRRRGDRAGQRRRGQHGAAEDESASPAQVVGHRATREQRDSQPDAHRAEDPRLPFGPGTQRRCRRGQRRQQEPHRDRGGMPATGRQPVEQRVAGCVLVEVERLRVVAGGEILNLRGRHLVRSAPEGQALRQIVEPEPVRSTASTHRKGRPAESTRVSIRSSVAMVCRSQPASSTS